MALHRKMPPSMEDLTKRREEQREDMRSREEHLNRVARNIFKSNDGKELLDILIQAYYEGSMVGDTVEKTYFKLGQRDVVAFLQGLLKEK